jgi:hypothetical protein
MQNNNEDKPEAALPREGDALATPPSNTVTDEKSAELASIESGEASVLEPAPVASPANTLPAQNPLVNGLVTPVEKKSHKKLWISLAALVTVLVVGAGGFGYWYTAVRVADVEYEKAIASVNAMIDAADGIEAYRESATDSPALKTSVSTSLASVSLDADMIAYLKKLSTAKEKAVEFLANEKVLSQLAVVAKDTSVKSVYDTNKKIIESYGKSADEYYRTGHEFMTIMAYCQAGADAIQEPGLTANKFASDMKSCNERLTANESLASSKFNDLIYTKYREAFLRMISVAKELLSAKTQSQYDKAMTAFMEVQDDLDGLDTTQLEEIQPTQLPKDQLNRLKEKLEERRHVFFR